MRGEDGRNGKPKLDTEMTSYALGDDKLRSKQKNHAETIHICIIIRSEVSYLTIYRVGASDVPH